MKRPVLSKRALEARHGLPANTAVTVRAKLEQYAADPASLANNVRRLKGRDNLRLRVGDWRIIFEEDAETITVLDIGSRGGVY